MNYELKKYSFGETLGKGFNLYLDNFIPIVLVSILCEIPSTLFVSSNNYRNASRFGASFDARDFANYFLSMGINMVISIVVGAILSAFIIHLVSRRFLGTAPANRDNRSISILPLILPVIGLSLLEGVIVLLGVVLLIMPGVILALGLSMSTQVLVIEKCKVLESIKRSWALTKGIKGEIFAIYVVASIIVFFPTMVVVIILTILRLDTLVLTYVSALIGAIFSPVIYCIMVVVYFNIRIQKEGFNIEHLAQQFNLADSAGPSVES